MQGLLGDFPEKKDNDGYLICRAPFWGGEEQVPWINMSDDFGDLVHGIFLDPTRWNHRPVQAAGDPMSFGEMTRIFSLGMFSPQNELNSPLMLASSYGPEGTIHPMPSI